MLSANCFVRDTSSKWMKKRELKMGARSYLGSLTIEHDEYDAFLINFLLLFSLVRWKDEFRRQKEEWQFHFFRLEIQNIKSQTIKENETNPKVPTMASSLFHTSERKNELWLKFYFFHRFPIFEQYELFFVFLSAFQTILHIFSGNKHTLYPTFFF